MFQHRYWILQRSNIELLRECQRQIQEQFSEKLSLTQTDLIERIFLFSLRSSNPRFNETVNRLKESLAEASYDLSELPGQEPAPAEVATGVMPASSQRETSGRKMVYRGRQVAIRLPEPGGSEPVRPMSFGEELSGTTKRPRRVYRGQVIED